MAYLRSNLRMGRGFGADEVTTPAEEACNANPNTAWDPVNGTCNVYNAGVTGSGTATVTNTFDSKGNPITKPAAAPSSGGFLSGISPVTLGLGAIAIYLIAKGK